MLRGYAKAAAVEMELPEHVPIVPSKPNPWRSSKAPGARFTHVQLSVMERAGMDPNTVETVRCRSTATIREYYWPETSMAPVFVFECPVLEHRPNGFRLVIAPAGDRKIVHESGRLKKGQ